MTATDNPDVEPEASIFVVDDEEALGRIVAAILEMEGFVVRFFSNGPQALKAFCSQAVPPRLLVSDYVMVPMNGMELIHKCKAARPSLRTILYSGYVDSDITTIYIPKPDAFMSKPFLPDTLLGLVNSLLPKA